MNSSHYFLLFPATILYNFLLTPLTPSYYVLLSLPIPSYYFLICPVLILSSPHTYLQIEEVCQDGKLAHDLGVPSKLTNYLAYIDLVLLRLTLNTSN